MPRFVYLAIALLPGVLSQTTTTAVCSVSSVSWTFNSLGASPCQVAADLGGVCTGGVFEVQPLDSGFMYEGPTLDTQNSCRCSSVFYSLVSACAACQDRSWTAWADYDANCTATSDGEFPLPIPAGTRVPGWAYADVTRTGIFNLTVAESLDLNPESTGTASSTSPTSTSSTSGQSGSSSGSNVGAIVGGVIGGVFGLALIGGIIFCFLRRRRQLSEQQPPPLAFNTIPYMAAPHTPDQNMGYNPTVNPFTPVTPAHQTLYDPSDPSTFPSSAPGPASSYTSTFSPLPQDQAHSPFQGLATQVGQHSSQVQMPGPAPVGRYRGVPEV